MRTPSRLPLTHATASLCLALLSAACGGGDVSLPPDGRPAAIAVTEGDEQSGRVGEPLPDPLVVQVTDSRGRPVEGATVAFEFNSAGAGASVVPEEKTTNGDGLADARLVLGTTVGRQTGRARVVAGEGSPAVQTSFSAVALSEDANSMAAAAGQDQTGHVGEPLDDRLVVEVTDGFGNPVAGVPISWTAAGGGSVSEAVVETDEDGRSRVERILGPTVGQQTALASSEGLAGSPVVFVHTAVAGDASRLTVVSGGDQSAEAGTMLPAELVVRLVDAEGNGVPNTAVTWVVASGGGGASPQNSTTDGDGYAATEWTLGGTLGEQRLDAVVSGVGFVSFRATATAGAPASLFIRTQPSESARNGVRLERQPVIQLQDGRGNDVAVAGVQVTAELNGGGELEGTTRQTTDASGRAIFTDLAISGPAGNRTLAFRAIGYAPVTSNPIALQAIGTTTTITGDSPDPSQAGTPFTVSFSVRSDGPTPTGTVSVSDGQQSCSGPLSNGSGSCSLTLNTQGQRTLTATYGGGPGLDPSSDTEPHTVSAAPPPPPATTTTTITSDDPDPSVSGTTFTVRFTVTSGAGTPTGSVTVRVSGGTPTCTGTLSGGAGSCELTLSIVGERTLTATYSGGPGLSGSSDTEPHTVAAAPPPPPPSNEPPDADYNWHCEGLTCDFTDASDDDDGSVVAWSWDFGGTGSSTQQNPTHTFPGPGEYEVRLTVTDDDGATDVSSAGVKVEAPPPPNQAPVADFSWDCDDLECDFEDQSSDSDGSIQSRDWNFGDGDTSSGSSPDHEYAQGGTYQVTLTVTDNDGAQGTVTKPVTVAAPPPPNQGPTAAFTENCSNLSCSFNSGGSTDSDGTIVGYSWNFGDGNTSNEPNPGHTYAEGDTYTVTLEVRDDDGATDDVTRPVTVTAPPPPNSAPTAVNDGELTDLGTPVVINVLANDTDPDGDALTVTIASDAENGVAVLNEDETVTYTPDGDFSGEDSFTYTVSDGSLTSNVATVTVTVSAPAPSSLGILQQPSDEAESGQPFDRQPIIQLRDGSGGSLAISGVQVNAEVASGDATAIGNESTTDGSGQAIFTELAIVGGGDHRLIFTATGYTSVTSDEIEVEEDG